MVQISFVHVHQTTASLYAVLRRRQWLDVSQWPVDDMGKRMKVNWFVWVELDFRAEVIEIPPQATVGDDRGYGLMSQSMGFLFKAFLLLYTSLTYYFAVNLHNYRSFS